MRLRAWVRRVLPLQARQDLRQFWRNRQDGWRGLRFVRRSGDLPGPVVLQIVQPVRRTSHYENKLINLRRAAALLDRQLLGPGADWSFWHAVGRPAASNGFVAGRNLVGGVLVEQTGGGLCQVASLLYHLALLGGLKVVERHAHSVDIYREEERFTPLGADATVVWGFKDLRISNPHPFAVAFQLEIGDAGLCGGLLAAGSLVVRRVAFLQGPVIQARQWVDTRIEGVTVLRNEYLKMVAADAPPP